MLGIFCEILVAQREARKPLVAELKLRKTNGEKDLTIFNGKIVQKRVRINKEELVCFYINARNLVNKFEQFKAWVYALNADIIGVTESWAWSQVLDSELLLQGYDIFRQDREVDRAGGGVLLYVRSTLNAVKFIPKTHYPEHVWCCLLDSHQNQVHVGVCYRTPTVNIYMVRVITIYYVI